MLLFPYRLSITSTKLPWVNWVIIALTVVVFGFQMFDWDAAMFLKEFVLRDWDIGEMIGSMFLHGGFLHIIGNMIFLWVFGNAVCASVGNAAYPALYLLLGMCASAMHLAFSAQPAIGASGAINGVMGMSLVLFPVSRLNCAYVFFIPFVGLAKVGTFSLKAFWMISLWFVFDVFGILTGSGGTAYWAHLGGFAAGMIAGWVVIKLEWAAMFDPTLPDVIAGRAETETLESDIHLENRLAEMTDHRLAPPARLHERNEVARKHSQEIHDLWTGGAAEVEELPAEDSAPPANAVLPPSVAASAPAPPPVPAVTPAPAAAAPRHLKLRILRVQKSVEVLTCYFVNEGDEVSDLAVSAGGGVNAEIYPVKLLRRRDSGWMRLSHPPPGGG